MQLKTRLPPRPHQPVGCRTFENLKAMIHAFDNGDLRSISKALNRITAAARLDIKWLKARLAGKPIDPSVMRAREAAITKQRGRSITFE